ncbi:MAG: cupin domain-containing protein [Acidimicrobiales bacterium]
MLEVKAGTRLSGSVTGAGELWFVVRGEARLKLERRDVVLQPGVGVLGLPGQYEIEVGSDDLLELALVVLPLGTGGIPRDTVVSYLDDCEVETTGDRQFRVLIGPPHGCSAATQFVGDIPPGRAPVHEHTYDEVVRVLTGVGIVHLEEGDRPLGPGTCLYLPPGSPHCLENTGGETMRVLGVFHPGGSPAAKKGGPG